MPRFPNEIEYGEKYYDDIFEYRHVMLPKHIYNVMPKSSLQATLTEQEWRSLGIQQSRGWVHYQVHRPEPYILLFRRPKGTDPSTGLPPRGFKSPDDHLADNPSLPDQEVEPANSGNGSAALRRLGYPSSDANPNRGDQFSRTH